MEFKHLIGTAGDGLWSSVAKNVQLTNMDVPYINDEKDFGELRVIFDVDTWNIHNDGLIYTDKHFLKCIQVLLMLNGMAGKDVDYSEQGMQGDNYVSFDVGEDFLTSWVALNGVEDF